eukprot:TRINITY_DN94890_c0_g1_i1.p3 TRINITY_DN94890_c0_g1~~TRINITY_DN94890_c0_g1_i1.p3  ORF type:complete len:130 (-),score=10.00 TRINITY_DN94890_c0_g1_i1:100-489(-)
MHRNAKSLVKHLLQADLSKRYGNLKGGVKDIKEHRFFKGLSWDDLLVRKLKSPYIPPLKYCRDQKLIRLGAWTTLDTSRSIPTRRLRARPLRPPRIPLMSGSRLQELHALCEESLSVKFIIKQCDIVLE